MPELQHGPIEDFMKRNRRGELLYEREGKHVAGKISVYDIGLHDTVGVIYPDTRMATPIEWFPQAAARNAELNPPPKPVVTRPRIGAEPAPATRPKIASAPVPVLDAPEAEPKALSRPRIASNQPPETVPKSSRPRIAGK